MLRSQEFSKNFCSQVRIYAVYLQPVNTAAFPIWTPSSCVKGQGLSSWLVGDLTCEAVILVFLASSACLWLSRGWEVEGGEGDPAEKELERWAFVGGSGCCSG